MQKDPYLLKPYVFISVSAKYLKMQKVLLVLPKLKSPKFSMYFVLFSANGIMLDYSFTYNVLFLSTYLKVIANLGYKT